MWGERSKCNVDDIVKLMKKRMSYRQIAEELGSSKTTISRIAIQCDFKKYYNPMPTKRKKQQKKQTQKPAQNKTDCKTCVHRDMDTNLGIGVHCGYIWDTGHMRGCSWENCARYEKGKPKRRGKIT